MSLGDNGKLQASTILRFLTKLKQNNHGEFFPSTHFTDFLQVWLLAPSDAINPFPGTGLNPSNLELNYLPPKPS